MVLLTPLPLAAYVLLASLTWYSQEVEGRSLPVARKLPALASPDYTVYHLKKDILAEVADIVQKNPKTMKVEYRKVEESGYNAEVQIVTVETAGLTEGNYTDKARIYLDFGEHAREFISAELGLLFMRTIRDPDAIKAVFGGGQRGEDLLELVNRCVWKILPMENTRGRDLVEQGKLCERKNGRGVDPNRNWSVDWGKKEKDYDPNEEYPGLRPFSEPESQIVRKVGEEFQPHVWVNVHSGMEAMFVPWDHKAEVAPAAQGALAILQAIHKDIFGPSCVVGSGGKSVGYLAHGTATDWMFSVLHVPIPYTWEIYGDFQADFHDCFRMFNPVGRKEYDAVLSKWLKAIFRLVELLPSHPSMAFLNTTASSTTATASSTVASIQAPGKLQEVASTTAVTGTAQQQQQQQLQEQPVVQQQQPQPDMVIDVAVQGPGYQLWLNLGLGVGGLLVVGVLVVRYLRSTRTPTEMPSRATALYNRLQA